MNDIRIPLHSTMFLLNLTAAHALQLGLKDFTFHNVSIKSGIISNPLDIYNPLHSTMFLLNQ